MIAKHLLLINCLLTLCKKQTSRILQGKIRDVWIHRYLYYFVSALTMYLSMSRASFDIGNFSLIALNDANAPAASF
jgi:hypothetical protein